MHGVNQVTVGKYLCHRESQTLRQYCSGESPHRADHCLSGNCHSCSEL